MAKRSAQNITANDILTHEFDYIAQTAFQANEDRARVTSFYLVSVGSFVVALVTAQVEALQTPVVYLAFSALFLLLFFNGIITLKQLIRLRLAWLESVRAMNQIKAFYVANLPESNLPHAFRWSDANAPKDFPAGSVSHLLATQVSLLGACMLGVALVFGFEGFGFSYESKLAGMLIGLPLSYAILSRYYRNKLLRAG